jgi:hypothetical protein
LQGAESDADSTMQLCLSQGTMIIERASCNAD